MRIWASSAWTTLCSFLLCFILFSKPRHKYFGPLEVQTCFFWSMMFTFWTKSGRRDSSWPKPHWKPWITHLVFFEHGNKRKVFCLYRCYIIDSRCVHQFGSVIHSTFIVNLRLNLIVKAAISLEQLTMTFYLKRRADSLLSIRSLSETKWRQREGKICLNQTAGESETCSCESGAQHPPKWKISEFWTDKGQKEPPFCPWLKILPESLSNTEEKL